MELNEAVQRIILRHLKIVVGCLIAGLGLGYVAASGSPALYSATARLVLDAPAPKTGVEAAALANSGRAIATSYSHVAAALDAIKIKRDPARLAAHRINVKSVGSSDVLSLTVRDADPQVASALANALADDVVETRRSVAEGGIPVAVTKLDARIVELSAALAAVDKQIDDANAGIANSRDPQSLAAATAAASSERSRRETVSQQLLTVQTERSRLISVDAASPRAKVVDAANTPVDPEASQLLADMALGGLAGLTLALGLAALLEAVRPSVVGRRSLSLALDAPVLGQLTCCPANLDDFDVRTVQTTLRLAANAAGVSGAQLVAVDANDDLEALGTLLQATTWTERPSELLALQGPDGWDQAAALELHVSTPARPTHPFAPILLPAPSESARPLPAWPSSGAHPSHPSSMPHVGSGDIGSYGSRHAYPDPGRAGFKVQAFDTTSAETALDGQHSGFVVVVPEAGRRSDLETVADLIAVSRRPLLGIITYRKTRDCSSHHRRKHNPSDRVEPGGANK